MEADDAMTIVPSCGSRVERIRRFDGNGVFHVDSLKINRMSRSATLQQLIIRLHPAIMLPSLSVTLNTTNSSSIASSKSIFESVIALSLSAISSSSPSTHGIHADRVPTSTPRGKFPYKYAAVYAANRPFANRNCGRRAPQNAFCHRTFIGRIFAINRFSIQVGERGLFTLERKLNLLLTLKIANNHPSFISQFSGKNEIRIIGRRDHFQISIQKRIV